VLEAFRAAGSGNPRWSEAEVGKHRGELFDEYYSAAQPENSSERCGRYRAAGVAGGDHRTTDVGLTSSGRSRLAHPRAANAAHDKRPLVDGFSLPGAIAAKLLAPDRPVVCFTGDGGFAMVQSELKVAASLKLGVLVIVFCDNSLHRIELKQMVKHYPALEHASSRATS